VKVRNIFEVYFVFCFFTEQLENRSAMALEHGVLVIHFHSLSVGELLCPHQIFSHISLVISVNGDLA